jgi:hypothetical protein
MNQAAGAGRPGREPLVILPLLLLLLVEFVWFDTAASRHHAWVYPRWNDQIQYLTESYTAFEDARTHGTGPALWRTLVNPSAQGTLHDAAALLLFQTFGASRGAALAVNLLALFAWQAALYAAVLRGTRRLPLAWAATALPLALDWAWSGRPGSAVDFRLDHLAMCAGGVALAAALATDGLRARSWSVAFGLATGVTLLTRFLTGTYFILILLAAAGWIAAGRDRGRRFGNLALAALAAAALAGPVFWLNRAWVWDYYVIGHFTGPESAIRNPNMGVPASLQFVARHTLGEHLGTAWWALAAGGAALLAPFAGRGGFQSSKFQSGMPPRDWWFWGLAFVLAPALILTLHRQKSEIVLGFLVPGFATLVVCTWAALLGRVASPWGGRILAAAMLAGGFALFGIRLAPPAGDEAFLRDAHKVNALADYIYRQSKAAKLASPRVAVDQVTDSLDAQVLRVIAYERQHEWVPFIMTLPTAIMAPEEAVVRERLAQSDFVFLTEEGDQGGWPYDERMRSFRPWLRAWCEANLRPMETFTLFGRRMTLYQRREIP